MKVVIVFDPEVADRESIIFTLRGVFEMTQPGRIDKVAKDSKFPLLNQHGKQYGFYIILDSQTTLEVE